ncbi:MAG: hypothetical protein ABI548_23665 [Polyangiaceae bacterium]
MIQIPQSSRFVVWGRLPRIAGCAVAITLAGCGKSGSDSKPNPATGGSSSNSTGGASSSTGGSSNSTGGSSNSTGGAGQPVQVGSTTTVSPDGTSVTTTLPMLPQLTNVLGTLREDSVGIDFDPVDGATDYRVYELPKDQDITAFSDGTLTVANAIYRCAGMRQTFDIRNNLNTKSAGLTVSDSDGITAKIGATPTADTLGYVYVTAASDRLPVYALANYFGDDEVGWRASRLKVYTTDTSARQTMLGKGWRDDGISFYVPSAAASSTQTVYSSQVAEPVDGQDWTSYKQYYFTAAGMSAHKGDTSPPAPAFQVLSAQGGDDTKPLLAVLYVGSHTHVELAAGLERYKRAAYQGSLPDWHLEWAGLTKETTLVVEALKDGCPFQGFLSPQHVKAAGHQILYTLADLQKASSTGEVFINGQYDNVPAKATPIARSFLKVTATPHNAEDWDWYQGFGVGTDLGTVTEVPGCTDYHCDRWRTTDLDISAYRLDEPGNVPVVAFGQFLGQFWEAFDDDGADVTGKLRITARTKAKIDSDPNKYLHATMSVDIMSTDRRYPQLIISDQNAPVQEGLANAGSNTVLVQPILGPSMRVEVQAFHGIVGGVGPWDVNNQAPEHRLIDYDTQDGTTTFQPNEPPFEHAGMDRMTKFDVFLSSQRIYVFMDGQPAGCTTIPSTVKLAGDVTYTVGDVLYHEGADDELVCSQAHPYTFMHTHQCTETKRHFDDLAFKSGSAPPTWDNSRFPCLPY